MNYLILCASTATPPFIFSSFLDCFFGLVFLKKKGLSLPGL